MRIVLCCGDRDWNDQKKVDKVLAHEHKKHPIDFVIEGGQEKTKWEGVSWSSPFGGDYQAKIAAQKLGIQVIECPANWDKFKKGAGPIRNEQQMNIAIALAVYPASRLKEKHGKIVACWQEDILVLAFHSHIERSKGTKNMIQFAKAAGVKVKIIK